MMKRWAKWGVLLVVLLPAVALLAGCGGGTQGQQESTAGRTGGAAGAAEFFKGKTVNFIIPYKTGGGYDAWVRLVGPFLEKNTGATFVPQNVPGAGSLVGTAQIYAAQPNGLTVGIINGPGCMQAQLTGAEGVKFDLAKFTYIGRLTADPRVICVGPRSKYKSIEDMKKSTAKVKFGAPGLGSSMFMDAALLAEALGINVDIVTGYETSEEVDLAVIRGELDAACGSYASKVEMMKAGDMIAVLQYDNEKNPEMPEVPFIGDFTIDADKKGLIDIILALGQVGRPIVAPPDLPADRAQFLAEALKKSLEDPELLRMAGQQDMQIVYLPPAELQQVVDAGVNLSPELKQRLQDTLAKYQPKRS